MDVDSNDPGTQTTITKGPSGNSQIIHVRQDSASELEALFNTVMNPNFKSKSLPMKSRNLPKSFFVQPDRPRQNPHFHHSHSQSMGVLGGSTPAAINHSRSSSSDSSASLASPAAVTPNANNNNGASVSSPGMPPGSPMNAALSQKGPYSFSPAQRRVAHNQFGNARNLQIPQVAHSRSKSSPASLQLMDVSAAIQVKPSDIPPDMPLPAGWSAAKTSDGQQYFMNHNERTTTWEDPRIAIIKQQRQVTALQNQSLVQQNQANAPPNIHVSGNVQNDVPLSMDPSMPLGWEQAKTPMGEVYYINHQTRTTSWVDPRVQNANQQTPANQSNNVQLQQQLIKVNQMEMAASGGMGRAGQQSMIKHLMQDKEMNMRRQLLNKQLSSSGVDPFLGSGNPNYHQRDPSLDSGVGMGNNYNVPRSDEYLANVEEMDTGAGDVNRRLHGGQGSHMVATSNHQAQQLHNNPSRFPDFLDSLPASNVDFASGGNPVSQSIGQTGSNTGTVNTLDSSELVPTLQDSLPQDFDVESMLNHVKTENNDNSMIWL